VVKGDGLCVVWGYAMRMAKEGDTRLELTAPPAGLPNSAITAVAVTIT